jgi:hypothetical protein
MKRITLCLSAVLSVSASSATSALAGIAVPDATWYSDAGAYGGGVPAGIYGTTSTTGTNNVASVGPYGYATVDITMSAAPLPIITNNSVAQTGQVGGYAQAGGDASSTYYVQVVGPQNSPPILLDVTGYISANSYSNNANAYGSADANLLLSGPGLNGPNGVPGGTWHFETTSGPQQISVSSLSQVNDGPITVSLSTDTYAIASGLNAGAFGMAIADPFFYIDPSVPNADLYQIIVSPGVGNSPVSAPGPTPGAGLAGLAALALAGLYARTRRA